MIWEVGMRLLLKLYWATKLVKLNAEQAAFGLLFGLILSLCTLVLGINCVIKSYSLLYSVVIIILSESQSESCHHREVNKYSCIK